jgi:hypothetical protein
MAWALRNDFIHSRNLWHWLYTASKFLSVVLSHLNICEPAYRFFAAPGGNIPTVNFLRLLTDGRFDEHAFTIAPLKFTPQVPPTFVNVGEVNQKLCFI